MDPEALAKEYQGLPSITNTIAQSCLNHADERTAAEEDLLAKEKPKSLGVLSDAMISIK